jgi:uncharacterized protein YecE (DUF72 family)
MPRVAVGCCGFGSSRAAYYGRMAAVEVQHTFYNPPRPATLAGWRAEAPPGFVFAIKAWQLITHASSSPTYRRLRRPLADDEAAEAGSFRPTATVEAAWEATLASAGALAASAILFQCPPSFGPTERHVSDLREFFRAAGRSPGERAGRVFAWEPRGGWPHELVGELCDELDLWHAVDPFAAPSATPGRSYFRLHGRTGWRYRYENHELADLAAMLESAAPAFVFFNNRHMLEDAGRFRAMLAGGSGS